jgi:hypothetical protein
MTKGLVCSLLLAILAQAASRPAGAAPAIKTESGRLQKLIEKLASGDYVLGEPNVDKRPYIDPTPVLHAFRHLASALAWGDLADAARRAAELDYEVVKFTDNRTKNDYYVLREDLNRVKDPRGWGSYIVNPESKTDAIVEVPHPMADAQTPEIGGAVFEQAEARGLLLAGAHRDKADVPDLIDSIFHQVHMAWVGPAARVTAWQIHGFASYKHSFPRGVNVVASTGDGVVAPEVASLDAMFEEQGMTTYVFNDRPADSRVNRRLNGGVPGAKFMSLAATSNEQGRLSRSLGGSFVHVELESAVRSDSAARAAAAAVIAAVISGAPPRSGEVAGDAAADSDLALAQNDADGQTAAAAVSSDELADPRQMTTAASDSAAHAADADPAASSRGLAP